MTSKLTGRIIALWHLSRPNIFHRRPLARSCVSRTTGDNSETSTSAPNLPSSEDTVPASPTDPTHIDDPLNNLQFPDGHNPHENPLASVSHEGISQDTTYWTRKRTPLSPPVYERKVSEDGTAYGRGGRKRSKARVWLREGTGIVTVNGSSWVDYFPRVDQRDKILRPMHLLGMTGKFDLHCKVAGGGQTGQAEAIRFCVARAMQNWHPNWRPVLKKAGLLTRDSRIVEMKKYGRKKARKSFQWVKR